MSPNIERLLQPLPAPHPCGLDLTNSQELDNLVKLTKGEPPKMVATGGGDGSMQGTPPNWAKVEDRKSVV